MNLKCEPATDFQEFARGGRRDPEGITPSAIFERESRKSGVKRSALRHPPREVYAGFKGNSQKRVNDQIGKLLDKIDSNIKAFAGGAAMRLLNTLDLNAEEITENQRKLICQGLMQDLRYKIYDSPLGNYFLAVPLPDGVVAVKKTSNHPLSVERTEKGVEKAREHITANDMEIQSECDEMDVSSCNDDDDDDNDDNDDDDLDQQPEIQTEDEDEAQAVFEIETEEKVHTETFINDDAISTSSEASYVFEPSRRRPIKKEPVETQVVENPDVTAGEPVRDTAEESAPGTDAVGPTEQTDGEETSPDNTMNWEQLNMDDLLPCELLERIRNILLAGPVSDLGRHYMAHWIKKMLHGRLVERDIIQWSTDGQTIENRCPMPANLAQINFLKEQRANGINPIYVRKDGTQVRPEGGSQFTRDDGLFTGLLDPEELQTDTSCADLVRKDDANDCIIVCATPGSDIKPSLKIDPEQVLGTLTLEPAEPADIKPDLQALPTTSVQPPQSSRLYTRDVEQIPIDADRFVSAPDAARLLPLLLDAIMEEHEVDIPVDDESHTNILRRVLEKQDVQVQLPKKAQRKASFAAYRAARLLKLQRVRDRQRLLDESQEQQPEMDHQAIDDENNHGEEAEKDDATEDAEIRPVGLAIPNIAFPLQDGWIEPRSFLRGQAVQVGRLSPPATRYAAPAEADEDDMEVDDLKVKIEAELRETGAKERSIKDLLFNPNFTPTVLVTNVSEEMNLHEVIGRDMVEQLDAAHRKKMEKKTK